MNKYILRDTFNDRTISTHRSIEAAVRKQVAFAKAVRKSNGSSSYIPTKIEAADGSDISERVCDARNRIVYAY